MGDELCALCEEGDNVIDFNCPVEYPRGSGEIVLASGKVCLGCYAVYPNDLLIALGLLKKEYDNSGYETHEEFATAIKEEKHKPIVSIRR